MKRLLVLAAIAGVTSSMTGDAFAQKRDLVVAAEAPDLGKLDPHQASAGADKGILNWMFNALVRIEPGRASPEFIEPDLAESWTSNEAGTEWTFKIRQGVKCHDGEMFTAKDAAYSLQRSADKDRSAFAGDFSALQSAEAVDDGTLKVTLKNPIPSLLGLLSNYHGGMMVCMKAAEDAGFATHPIGTGPFKFEEYQPQQYVKMVANADYWRGAPQLETVTFRYIPSDATRDLAFESGEVDMVFGRQTQQWVDRMKRIPDVTVAALEPAELNQLHLNTAIKPLDDIRVRQAIAHAISRDAMVALNGVAVSRPAVSVIPNGALGINENTELLPYDVEKAKSLLAEAGYPDGVKLKSVTSTLPALLRISEAVQAQLRAAGIELELETVDHPTYHATIRKDLSAVTLYQAARFPVADVYLSQFFYSPAIVGTPTGITNFSHCSVADEEIEAARSERDAEKQKELWRTAQQKIAEAVCGVPMSESLVMWGWKNNLDLGYEMHGSLNLMPHVTEKAHFKQ